ncbi:MAG: nucleoside-diphosphate sugar epimerase/dehydratase [Syntrophomonas sp.]
MSFGIRQVSLLLIDVLLANIAVILAMLLRFEGKIPSIYIDVYLSLIPIITSVTLAFLIGFHLYRRIWEYASTGEILAILGAATCSMAVLVVFIYLFKLQGLPRSVYIISWILIFVLIGTSRFSWRLLRNYCLGINSADLRRVLIVGAGDAGVILCREIESNPQLNFKVVAFVDDDQKKQGMMVCGIKVEGDRFKIPSLVKRLEVDEIIVAMPSVFGRVIKEIVDICNQSNAQVRILPGIYQSASSSLLSNLRKVNMEDLLHRETVHTELEAIAGYIGKKTVLVTGAGGSIGSELCRQLLDFSPASLVMMDCCENNLFELEMELANFDTSTNLYFKMVDIKDPERLNDVFKQYHPQVVFHAAAYKHVPMIENHPEEAINNNVIGTRNVAEMSDRYEVNAFILISTDKAVNPTSIMGASKRIAELFIKEINRKSKTRFAAVRFGNVLGSRGSVIPIFMQQIKQGGPVTVTHPDMQRYFMTIPEAVQLVIQAGAMAEGGEIFVLDMGDPVKIVDLARDLIRLAGYEPEKDIPIVYTGIRPGEKLYEELFTYQEGLGSTRHERILISWEEMDSNSKDVFKSINLLLKKPVKGRSEILRFIMSLVPEYQKGMDGKETEIFAQAVSN